MALVALATAAIGGLLCYVDLSQVAGIRSDAALTTGPGGAVNIETRLQLDGQKQDDTIRGLVSAHTGGAPIEVERSIRSEPRKTEVDGVALTERVVLMVPDSGNPGDPEVLLRAGTWPQAPDDGVLHEFAARNLDVDVGDVLTVDDVAITVVGLWLPADAGAAGWSIDVLARDGTDGRGIGPLIVAQEMLEQVQADPFVRWTVELDAENLTSHEIEAAAAGLPGLPGALKASDAQSRGVVLTGELARTTASIAQRISTARTVSGVPVALVALVSAVAIMQVAHLVTTTRRRETQMVIARGASVRQLTVLGSVEALVVSVTGALLGTVMSVAGLTAARLGPFLPQALPTLAIVLGAVTISTSVITTGATARDARAISSLTGTDVSGRTRSVVELSGIVLLIAAGAFTGWRLWLVRTSAGAQLELLVVVAPAVILLALVFLGLLILAPGLRGSERIAKRGRGLSRVLATRQVSRRLVAFAVPALLVALASGGAVVAASYAHTTSRVATTVTELDVGTDLRLTVGSAGPVTPRSDLLIPEPIREQAADAGTVASVVVAADVRLGEDQIRFLALPTGQIPAVMRDGGTGVAQETASALETALGADSETAGALASTGIALPGATTTFEFDLVGRAGTAHNEELWGEDDPTGGPHQEVTFQGWFIHQGELIKRELGTLDLPIGSDFAASHEQRASSVIELPDRADGWQLIAIDVAATSLAGPVDVEAAVTGIRATRPSGKANEFLGPEASGWEPVDLAGNSLLDARAPSGSATASIGTQLRVRTTVQYAEDARLRLLPQEIFAQRDRPLPVVVTDALLERLSLVVGDPLEFQLGGTSISAQIVGTNQVLPGGLGELALTTDLDRLRSKQFGAIGGPGTASQIWVGSQDEAAIQALTADLAQDLAADAIRTSNSHGPQAAISISFWLAAGAAVILALAGTWSVLSALAQERRGEVAALRAVGLSVRTQQRSRITELGIVSGFGITAGVIAGFAVAWLIAPVLTRATILTTPAGLSMPIGVQPLGLGSTLVLLVLGLLASATAMARTVSRQAQDLEYRQEAT